MRVAVIGGSAPLREALVNRLEVSGCELADGADRDAVIICCPTEELWQEAADNALWIPTVVVIADLDLELYRRAVGLGAGVVHLDNPTSIMFDVLLAALQGESLLPVTIAQQLVTVLPGEPMRPHPLEGVETRIVEGLLEEKSILQIARELNYSDRTIRRKLQGIYVKLGVGDRRGAIEAMRDSG